MLMKRVSIEGSNPCKLKDIAEPHPHDVLCGRGASISNFVGNVRWRELINEKKEEYISLHKLQRHVLSESIVYAVRQLNPPGRFLHRDKASGLWSDIGDHKANEKTAQALREGAPLLRKKLKSASKRAEANKRSNKKGGIDEGASVSSAESSHDWNQGQAAQIMTSPLTSIPKFGQPQMRGRLGTSIELEPLPLTHGPGLSSSRGSDSRPTRVSVSSHPSYTRHQQPQTYDSVEWQHTRRVQNHFPISRSIPKIPYLRSLQGVHPSRNVDAGACSQPSATDSHERMESNFDDRASLLCHAADLLLKSSTMGDDDTDPTTHHDSKNF